MMKHTLLVALVILWPTSTIAQDLSSPDGIGLRLSLNDEWDVPTDVLLRGALVLDRDIVVWGSPKWLAFLGSSGATRERSLPGEVLAAASMRDGDLEVFLSDGSVRSVSIHGEKVKPVERLRLPSDRYVAAARSRAHWYALGLDDRGHFVDRDDGRRYRLSARLMSTYGVVGASDAVALEAFSEGVIAIERLPPYAVVILPDEGGRRRGHVNVPDSVPVRSAPTTLPLLVANAMYSQIDDLLWITLADPGSDLRLLVLADSDLNSVTVRVLPAVMAFLSAGSNGVVAARTINDTQVLLYRRR